MKVNLWVVAIIILVVLFIASCQKREEMFDNSGALMQLSADHVPSGIKFRGL
jgi:hypothetical protein